MKALEVIALQIISDPQISLSLRDLASEAGVSVGYLQKQCKQTFGVSPKELQVAARDQLFRELLQSGLSVTDAIYQAGFSSSSRAHAHSQRRLGMTPKQYQAKAANINISYAYLDTALGQVLIAATDRGLCFVQFGNSKTGLLAQLKKEFAQAQVMPMESAGRSQLTAWSTSLNAYLSGKRMELLVPVVMQGTIFQQLVWSYLQTIPKGTIQSYSEVAKGIGKPRAVRAVASACARNNLAVVVPCHRVIKNDGAISKYRWGVARKRQLLELESQ